MSKKVTRLFEQYAPGHYDLRIAISDDKKSFTGSVVITGRKTGRPNSRLTLHQKGLKISYVKVTATDKSGDESKVEITRTVLHSKYDEVRLHTDNTIYPGKYTISMDFSGIITKNMDGIYPCFFTEDGVDKQLIATQFESHHAREVFPCIDEPEAKATFQLHLSHAKAEVALCNTPAESKKAEKSKQTTTFAKTPLMSTYLLAFIVGDMKYKEAKSKSGVTLRTYATPHQIENTEYALEVAVKCMDFYEEYFGIPYPLDKCDFIALPDFASGAMENWGAITFREQALLVDKNTSLSTKQWVAMVVAHELTHQWFGNLVTMRWWTDLWLNEGFASWMEYLALDSLYPEWDIWTQFAVDEQQAALKADALEHTHPIEVPVNHPDEIRAIFDIISYQKGSSVIHMLYNFLGPEGFKKGISHYLKQHAYKNTDTVDLWQALEDVTKKPVTDFMNAWTSQSGFPLVNVEVRNDHLKVIQTKFVTNPESSARNDNTLWPVPLLTESLGEEVTKKKVINIPIKSVPAKINNGQTGFYRVEYSNDIQKLQIQAIQDSKMSAVDRMGLLADGFEVTKAGYQPVTDYLELLRHYSQEDSLPVWEIIAGSLGAIRSNLSKTSQDNTLRDLMKPFIRGLVKPQLDRLGWQKTDGESHLDALLRPLIVGMAAVSDTKEVLEFVSSSYRAKIDNAAAYDPDLRSTILGTTARLGGQKEYDEMLVMYKESDSSDEKLALTASMTSFEQPVIHKQILELIKSDTVKTQDKLYWVIYSLMNRHSTELTWDWFRDNWDWLDQILGTDLSFTRVPLYVARNFNTDKQIKEYTDFFAGHMEPKLERSYQQGLEVAQTSKAWRKRDTKSAHQWFNSL